MVMHAREWAIVFAFTLIFLGAAVSAQETTNRVTEKRIGFHGIDVFVNEMDPRVWKNDSSSTF